MCHMVKKTTDHSELGMRRKMLFKTVRKKKMKKN